MNVFIDGWVLTQRNLLRLRHEPGTLLTIMLMPTVLVVLFGFVFGSAIGMPGSSNYLEYMMPGMLVLGTGTALSSAMVDVAMDQSRGVMDRLRSLPTNRVSVPLGQSGAEGVIGAYGLVVLMAYGLIVGWRPHNGIGQTLTGIGLLLLFRYTLAWVGTYLGLGDPFGVHRGQPGAVDAAAHHGVQRVPLAIFVPLSARRFARAGL